MAFPPAGRVLAAPGSIDLDGKTWALDGSVKTSIARVGRFGQTGRLAAEFDSTTFRLVDPEGDELTGSYQVGPKGAAELMPDGASLTALLTSKLERAAASEGVALAISTIDVTRLTARAKATPVATGIKLVLSVAIQAAASVTANGEALAVSFSTRLAGKGILEMSVRGTSWSIPYVETLAVRRLGKARGAGTLRLVFGPDAGNGLADGEFLVAGDGGTALHGSYTTDGKQKVTLSPAAAEVELLLAALIEEEAAGVVTNVSASLTRGGAMAKVKHGLSITLSLKLRFDAEGDVDGSREASTGSFTLKGSGVPD